ncbi:MAG: glycosyltransferase family 39 protein [Anaerolineae bacterium]|nr:glycosyltransferase family 39 protein [Anaerolineae bacterium]
MTYTLAQWLKRYGPIGLVLVTAVIVRIYGLGFGLPYAYHVDEPRYLYAAVGMLQERTLNPGWFHQPTLYTYMVAFVLAVYYAWGVVAGQFHSMADLFRPPYHFDGLVSLPAEFLLARLLTVILSVLTIWLVYKMCREWFGQTGAILAAAFLALSIFHVTSSHFIATDAPVALFIMAALYFCARLAQKGHVLDYLLVGLFVGLAVGTKYSAYVLVIPVALAHLLAWKRGVVRLFNPALLLMGGTAVVVFFFSTPYSVFNNNQFVTDLRYEWEHNKIKGHIGAEGDSGRWFLNQLLTGSDRWLTIMAICGFVWATWKREWPVVLVGSFVLFYFLSMASNLVHFERFLVPMIPPLAVGAGYFFAVLAEKTPVRYKPLLIMLGVLLLLEPAVRVVQFDQRLVQTDVRTTARQWITENLPPGTRVARELFAPDLEDTQLVMQRVDPLNLHPAEWYRQQGFEYLVFAEARYGVLWRDPERYVDLIAQYEALWQEMELVATFTGPYVGRPDHDILVYKVTP